MIGNHSFLGFFDVNYIIYIYYWSVFFEETKPKPESALFTPKPQTSLHVVEQENIHKHNETLYRVASPQQYEYTFHDYTLLALLQLPVNNNFVKYLIIMICPFAQKQAKQALLHMPTTSACNMKEVSVML